MARGRIRGRTPKQREADAERRAEALRLKKQGFTLDEIAKRMGYAFRSGPQKIIERALRELWEEPARDVLAQELAKCDEHERALQALIAGNLEGGIKGDDKRARIAIDAIARAKLVRDQRGKYLGLFAPDKTESTVKLDVNDDARGELLGRIARLAAAGTSSGDNPEPQPH